MESVKEVPGINYQCTKCGRVYNNKESAEVCCKQYHCKYCGKETSQFMLVCNECAERKHFDKATKMSLDEYCQKFPGNMVFYQGQYYSEVQELLDYLSDEGEPTPDYVWGTVKQWLILDADSIICDLEENSDLEDFEVCVKGRKELGTFIDSWNEKYGEDYFMENDIAVLLNEEIAK